MTRGLEVLTMSPLPALPPTPVAPSFTPASAMPRRAAPAPRPIPAFVCPVPVA
jgi:hypothetical protein